MPPKKAPKSPMTIDLKSSSYDDSETTFSTPRNVSLSLVLEGEVPGTGDWPFIVLFNGQIVLDGKWKDGLELETDCLPMNLKDIYVQQLVADQPLIFLLRSFGGKPSKDPDPLLNVDNRAGATMDLFPLVLGEEKICVKVSLAMINTGEPSGCYVNAFAQALGVTEVTTIPLMLTMISAHCLPYAKEGTVYISAIGLNDVTERIAVNFGMSLSNSKAQKLVWATASNAGQAANTMIDVSSDDVYIPFDFEPKDTPDCNAVHWNAMKRVLVDPLALKGRLSYPFMIEIAGVPKVGKIDVRGRYMAFVDAAALLEPGQYNVTTSAKLLFFNEASLPENFQPLLELPPTSAKVSARETDIVMDDMGHNAYVIIRLDLMEPLVPKVKLARLYEILGFSSPEGSLSPIYSLDVESPPEDPSINVRRIRKEGGALSVHKELSDLACRGAVPMNQSIKKTAANRLLMRVRTMLKQFPPGECSNIEWQDTATAQHAASRRAVTASFAPQPPATRASTKVAAARCRIADDARIADIHIENNLKVSPSHPRPLLSKALRCLENGKEIDARNYILQALSVHTRNKFLLWIFGGREFDKGPAGLEAANAAFRIATKGDVSDGTSNAIAWAAVHALWHSQENVCAAFVAVKKMRKCYELPREWKEFLKMWIETSGEEETFWIPSIVSYDDPILITAAFFLCLRCYAFSEQLLQCYEAKCATRGSRLGVKSKIGVDVFYVRAASHLIRREFNRALEVTQHGIKRFGPSSMMSQMRATCLACTRGWDDECQRALVEAEKAGAEPCPSLLLKAALSGFKTDPHASLQRAARAHKIAPSGQSALIIGRIFAELGEEVLAERWAACAVKFEPQLAEGWAFLALLALRQKNVQKARTMLRTAKQVGPVTADLYEEVKKIMNILKVESLPDTLVKNLCLCDYY